MQISNFPTSVVSNPGESIAINDAESLCVKCNIDSKVKVFGRIVFGAALG